MRWLFPGVLGSQNPMTPNIEADQYADLAGVNNENC
jgi:hypothetical protein